MRKSIFTFFLPLAERYKNSKPKWWGQRNREELPRSRVKLTQEQVDEIDRQKAASRAEDQADKIAMKHRGRNYRDGGTREGGGGTGLLDLDRTVNSITTRGQIMPTTLL